MKSLLETVMQVHQCTEVQNIFKHYFLKASNTQNAQNQTKNIIYENLLDVTISSLQHLLFSSATSYHY